jgi:hypothetical protein
LNIKEDGTKLVINVEFAYAWQVDEEDGNPVSHKGEIESIELPVVLTSQQVKQFLNVYWAKKYAILDALEQTLTEVKSLEGTTSEGDDE